MRIFFDIFNISFFRNVLSALMVSIIVHVVSTKNNGNVSDQNFRIHYIFDKRLQSKFLNFISIFYVVIVPIVSLLLYLIFFIIIIALSTFISAYCTNSIINLFINEFFMHILIIIISLIITLIIYKTKIFETFNIKLWIKIIYILLPVLILIISFLFNSIFLNSLLFILLILAAIIFQPRIDHIIYNKMDITLNNGMCYLSLNTKNVNFKKNICIIDIFDNTDADIKKEKILIPVSNIVSKRYYDLDYKIDAYYSFLLKHFPCIFIDQNKDKQDDI